ncbi:MAG: AAA family ATPase [Burkholderiales bacterium]
MTLNISQLRERVAARFPDVEQVDDSIIRFTKKAGELPFAVYYLDVAQDLPRTQETLTKYQDRVIGRHFFEGRKSLQWSNYLYFVTSGDRLASSELRKAKDLIERDRSYARKFVISEDDLDSVLAPPVVEPAEATPHANILSVWTNRLVEAGLDRAILSDDDLPTRLKLIESSLSKPTTKPQAPRRNVEIRAEPFIRSLQLKKFRGFPRERSFEFSTVNLIFGANGSGKTSLLEAIELFYCGRNKRNPDARPAYELVAALADGRTEKATGSRGFQPLRDRNLTWYGQPEIKTNNLYLSFARFNFLDTDAAVSLADSTSRIEEDLSKLLVGPDAAKTWRDIERVCEAVSLELRGIRPRKVETEEELAAVEKRLKEASGVQQESDSIRARLEEMIHRIGWTGAKGDKEAFAGKLVEALSELVALAHQAKALDWTDSPVSINGLAKYCREAKVTSEKAEVDISRLDVLRKSQKRLADSIMRDREALDLIEQARRLIDVGVPKRAAEQNKLQSTVATHSGWLAGLDVDALGVLSTADLDMKVAVCHEAVVSKRFAAEALLVKAKEDYANFSKLRDQSINLAQELRQTAERILRGSPKPDECPLCHTQFGPGELANHIKEGADRHLEALGQGLLTQLRQREVAVREATAGEVASGWLRKFCDRASLAAGISVRLALARVEDAKRALAEGQARLEALNSEVLTLESQGLSMARLEEISARLRELTYPLPKFSREAADRLLSTIDQGSANSSRTLEAERRQAGELQQTLEATLGSAEPGVQDLKGALSRLKERLTAVESIRTKLGDFSSSFPWSGTKPLAEFVVEAESVRKVAAELQVALGRERQAQATYAESIKRKEHLQGRLAEFGTRLKRLTETQSTLESLQREHSLKKAMDSALQENRAGIEGIFSRIHSPAEFRGLGSSWSTLVRKVDGSEAKLSEISTGQRAAFALSIFLAQNAQLTVAPPVVLIDDPIAHVDDLNSLSFLDYLREIVLKGRRQIFFATANDKLATLFERKFDFLGSEGFRRFDLGRETSPAASMES